MMKRNAIFGMSLLMAGMGFAVTAPVHADAMAVSLGAVFADDPGDQTAVLDGDDVTTTVSKVDSISVSAAAGAAAAAGGIAGATEAQTAAGAVDAAYEGAFELSVTDSEVGIDLTPAAEDDGG